MAIRAASTGTTKMSKSVLNDGMTNTDNEKPKFLWDSK